VTTPSPDAAATHPADLGGTLKPPDRVRIAVRRADWDLILSIISTVATGYFGIEQIRLDRRQLAIMEKQGELLNRRGKLTVELQFGANSSEFHVHIKNIGGVATKEFEWSWLSTERS
jgi:hypothetical protein